MQQPNHKYKTSDQKRSKPKGTLAEFKINDSCRNHLAGSDGRQTSWFSSSISCSCTLSRASERQLFTGLSYILIPYRDNELKHQLLCICLLVDRKGLCLFGKWFLQLHASFFINVNMAMLLISFRLGRRRYGAHKMMKQAVSENDIGDFWRWSGLGDDGAISFPDRISTSILKEIGNW